MARRLHFCLGAAHEKCEVKRTECCACTTSRNPELSNSSLVEHLFLVLTASGLCVQHGMWPCCKDSCKWTGLKLQRQQISSTSSLFRAWQLSCFLNAWDKLQHWEKQEGTGITLQQTVTRKRLNSSVLEMVIPLHF